VREAATAAVGIFSILLATFIQKKRRREKREIRKSSESVKYVRGVAGYKVTHRNNVATPCPRQAGGKAAAQRNNTKKGIIFEQRIMLDFSERMQQTHRARCSTSDSLSNRARRNR